MAIKYSVFGFILAIFGLYPNFSFIEASQQNFSGGNASSSHGTIYSIKVKAKTNSDHLYFDYLYVDGVKIPVVVKNQDNSEISVFNKKNILSIIAKKSIENRRKNEPDYVPDWSVSSFPIDSGAKAVLSYWLNGKQKYYKIKEFKVLSREIRP